MQTYEFTQQTDLSRPVLVEALHGVVFSADTLANTFSAVIKNNGTAVDLTGASVAGYAIRADGDTVIITGSASGSKASIVLPASAYVVAGTLDIVIKVTSGSMTATVAAWRGYVQRSTTDTIVDPGHVIPSLAELLAQIEACQNATTAANNAATNANNKATLANTAAGNADTKAGLANTAAGNANTAAGKIDNMTVAATGLSAGATPTATITEVNGHKHVAFGIPKGDTGDAFHIVKTYASIAAMEADYSGTDTRVGDYVMIVSTVEDPDNAKVYIKGSSAWSFVVDMSGATGIQGQAAYVHIRYAANEPTQDADMKTTPDAWMGVYSGTSSTAPTTYTSYTWYQYKGDKGDTGNTGATGADGDDAYVWIRYAANQPTQDSDMKTTADAWMGIYSGNASTAPTAYTSYTWYKIKGETGGAENVYGTTVPMSEQDSTKVATAIGHKADKVSSPTAGNFAGLDANGNLTDSGKAASDFVASNQGSANAGKALGIGNDGMVTPVPFSGDDFTGATASTAGTHGYVPAPAAGDQNKVLKGGGAWATIPETANEMPMSSSDSTTVKAVLDAVSNVVTEIPLTITPASWSSTSPYTYTWTDSRVLSDSSVEVDVLDTSADTTADYIDYAKSSGGGGIVFTANRKPTANVSIVITITNAQAHAGSSIDADTVATDAISGASNVDEALSALNSKLTQYETIQITSRSSGVTINTGSWAKRSNRVVTIALDVSYTGTTANGWVEIASVGSDNGVVNVAYLVAWDNTDRKAIFIYVNDSGVIGFYGPVKDHRYYGLITYIADTDV